MKRNFQSELEVILASNANNNITPSLLLHGCCAPCSSYVLEYLSNYFTITLFYYNPNIAPEAEYIRRLEEQRFFIEQFNSADPVPKNRIHFIAGEYESDLYYETIRGLEGEPEGGKRCTKCFNLRIEAAAQRAASLKFDYFTTTLSVSPHKNAGLLNEIGELFGSKYGIHHLPSDFKKRDGFKRTLELSREFGLYRQDYCGCEFSRNRLNP